MMKRIWLTLSICLVGPLLLFSGCNDRNKAVYSFAADGNVQTSFEDERIFSQDINETESTEAQGAKEIVVYLCGAVKKPGVLHLPEGSRLNDAVQAAGGFTEEASEVSVNLAAKLEDEEMIYILNKSEAAESELEAVRAASEERLIDINTADIKELCELPGIGESRARDIVMYREKNGAFQRKEDIMKVTGIKESLYEKICSLISVG